ncbi:ATP synthase F1 subunit epsilon [Fusobacterium ulcerans]|uniref:ATP synthase F1 subunit epsilon n=1 Tax=Fusobacterium ulcerans TaxID=861 RepID=UPI0026DCFDF6|nr:ATP synthase F1 subunit epsilon [Fusobacterium ulcerans]
MATFKVKVVNYQEKVLEQDAEFLLVRTTEGEMGILPNHSPFVAGLAIGEMKIRLNGEEKYYFVSGGFLEISNNNVTVLADEAMPCEMIDLERARKEAEEAKAKLDKLKEDKDILLTEKNLNEALVKVRLAERLL